MRADGALGRTTLLTFTDNSSARDQVRSLMAVEGDLAFRRRCETIVEWLDVRHDQTILDCGSGYGFVLRVLLELTPARIVGLELQPDRIKETRAFLGNHDRLELGQGNAMTLPFPDNSFDHAVCSEVLEHLPDDRAAMGELYRVLKPGGTLVVTVPSEDFPFGWDPPNWVLRHFGKSLRGERPWSGIWYGHLRLYSQDGLALLAADSRFAVEEQRGLTHVCPPFAHLLLYGIGKPMLQSGLIPARLSRQIDRTGDGPAAPSGLVSRAMAVLERIDAPNDALDLQERKSALVSIALLGRKTGIF